MLGGQCLAACQQIFQSAQRFRLIDDDLIEQRGGQPCAVDAVLANRVAECFESIRTQLEEHRLLAMQ